MRILSTNEKMALPSKLIQNFTQKDYLHDPKQVLLSNNELRLEIFRDLTSTCPD